MFGRMATDNPIQDNIRVVENEMDESFMVMTEDKRKLIPKE